MLYIRGHKIIKGYVGNAPVSHVGFGKSGLIKIKSENDGSDYPNMFTIVQYKFDNTRADVVPIFNDDFTYTYEDIVEGNVTTRTINSLSLPTKIQFGGTTSNKTAALLGVVSINTSNLTTMANMFQNCTKLTQLDVSSFDTSNVTNMNSVFNGCSSLTQLDVSNFDTSNVANMSYMFNGCSSLTTLDVSNFDTSKVTNMTNFIANASALQNFISCAIPVSFGASGTALTHDSLMSIINNLATVTTTQTLTLRSTNLAKLSSEEKAIATNKGWTLA